MLSMQGMLSTHDTGIQNCILRSWIPVQVRMETLLKCEEVLKKLYEKVEGVPFNR